MEQRFDCFESNEDYVLATLLDPRFKFPFYRNRDTKEFARNLLIKKVNEKLDNNEETNSLEFNSTSDDSDNQKSFATAMQKIINKNQKNNIRNAKGKGDTLKMILLKLLTLTVIYLKQLPMYALAFGSKKRKVATRYGLLYLSLLLFILPPLLQVQSANASLVLLEIY